MAKSTASRSRGRAGPRSAPGPGRGAGSGSGGGGWWEFRVLAWVARHPGVSAAAAGAVAVVVWAGAAVAVAVAAVVVAGLGVWRWAHPGSFEVWAGRWLRGQRRRWLSYGGGRWRRVMSACQLTKDGVVAVPRVVRVRSLTPSIDVLTVAMLGGQYPAVFEHHAEELAHALGAQRVGVTRVKPGRVALTVERCNPFADPVPAPAIPPDSSGVDLRALVVGRDERGRDFTIRVLGGCLLVAGTMGAGKGTFIWAPLRSMGPMIRDGLVRVRVIDLKGGVETARGRDLFVDWATGVDGALRILRAFRDGMRTRQGELSVTGDRKFTLSTRTPFEWLVIDELAMLSAYADRSEVREAMGLLGEIQTQGRALGFGVAAYVQEPSKDIVDTRELFTDRVCLAVTSSSHVDMVLGEGARDRGALADQIPISEDHAGTGFVIEHRTRQVLRVRGGHVTDADIDELVATCAPRHAVTS